MHKKINNSLTRNFIQGLRPLSNTLPSQVKKILKKNGFNLNFIVDNWTKIVGENISNSCYPANIRALRGSKNISLIINVIHGKEIDVEYNRQNIIDKINSYLGYSYIGKIELKVLNLKYSNTKKNKSSIIKANFDKNLKKVKNINLKEKLTNLIRAYNEKK